MRIGIDLYSFIPRKNFGVGPTNYAYTLVKHLIDLNKEHDFVLFTNKDNEEYFVDSKNCKVVKSKMPPSKGILRILHEQLLLPLYCWKERLDLIHFTGNVISFFLYKKAVFTVHDLMWKYYLKSNWVPLYKRVYYSIFCPASFKLARKIITMSEYIRQELLEHYEIDPDKVVVIPSASYVKDIAPTEVQGDHIRMKYGEGYLFTVTTTWPHKNLITLLKAFVLLKERGWQKRLIVVGQNRLRNEEIAKFVFENKLDEKDVLFLGFVPDIEIKYLFKFAEVLIFPSLYEGFGVPPLEAMRYGIPAVVSYAASLPEVCGDACLYADPQSPKDFADQIERILGNKELRAEMIGRGKEREKRFFWPDLAEATLKEYEKTFARIQR